MIKNDFEYIMNLEVADMKLLRVTASGFKNCADDTDINLVAQSKKTSEDKEYELVNIADELYVYSTAAFIGKNASGKTTAIELLDCCYSILGNFSLDNKHFEYDGVKLTIYFYHEGMIYRYETGLQSDSTLGNKATFVNQVISKKKYFKTKINEIFDDEDFVQVEDLGDLPEDTSKVFFILKKKSTEAVYFDSYGDGADTYQLLFRAMNTYKISNDVLTNVICIFDETIKKFEKIDDHNYNVTFENETKTLSDKELVYFLSSGTTKGLLLYIMVVASLQNGFDLLVDEIENHFHKTLVENIISLYKDKKVNKKNATLIFSTHYCELLDLFNRQDNLWVCRADKKITLNNMYNVYDVRSGILKSKQFYNNTFRTAVNYEELMNLKRKLMK